ncbi:MAG: hypothetical protein HYV07_31605 [Deltaproteobacteria bacterium]|nr:hypothetical protein [Deltaproteobacteria bacterium]
MEPTDLTIQILTSIRDEIRTTNTRIDSLRSETNERLDALGRRLVESEIRTATAITELAGTVQELTRFMRKSTELTPRVERCEREIDEIKRRLG